MASDKKSTSIYAEHNTPAGKKEYFRTKTFDLEQIISEVGRFVSVSMFINDRDGNKSISMIINESDAKYMPKAKNESAGEDTPQSNRPARRLDRV